MRTPKQTLIILFILLFSNLAFSQVVIKDTVVITPKGNGKSSTLSTSNPQYYIATISISCDALNSTHDPTFSRGAIVFQIGTSTVQLAGALNPGDLGRTGSIVYTSSPVTIDAPVQLSIGGAQCPLTSDSPLSFVIIIDSISVGSIVYQATYPFPTIQVAYPLQAQDIYGVTTIHGEAQVNPSPDSSATVTWTVSNDSSDQRSNQPDDFDITGYSGVAYVVATATNRYGSTESDPVQIWIDPMNTPAGNKIYTRYGGTLTIGINGADPSFYDPANAMQLTLNNTPLLSSSVTEAQVSVGQWSTLDFRLMKNGHERVPGGNLQILSGYGQADFDETDYYTLFSFYIYLTIDSTQQTLPPNWLYGDPFFIENPFAPSPTLFIAPVTGELMLQITGASTAAIDTLFLQSPVKKALMINPSGYVNDTLDCGGVTAGDTIQFYLRSNMGIVAGQNMYPQITLPDTGVMASIAVKGGSKGSISPLNQRKLLLKPQAGGNSLQNESFTEKTRSPLIGSPSSTRSLRAYGSKDPAGVVGLQQKKIQAQSAKHGGSNPAIIIIGPGNTNPVTTLAFEDWTDLDFDDLQAGAWISTAGCPTVVFSSDHMNPGDTVDVTIKKKLNDTTYIDYPAGTLFNIGIWSGDSYGSLLANGSDSTSFDDVTMPIKFIATDSIAVDSVVVTIAGSPENGSSASGIAEKSSSKMMQTGAYKAKKGGKKFLAVKDGSTCSGPAKETIKRSPKRFCMDDTNWADSIMDHSSKSIGDVGCSLVSLAWLAYASGANVDPQSLVAYMNNPAHYLYNAQNQMQWWAIDSVSNIKFAGVVGNGLTDKKDTVIKGKTKYVIDLSKAVPVAEDTLSYYLNQSYLIIVQVYNPTSGDPHYVVVKGKNGSTYSIMDPACYSVPRNTLSDMYSDKIYKILLFKHK